MEYCFLTGPLSPVPHIPLEHPHHHGMHSQVCPHCMKDGMILQPHFFRNSVLKNVMVLYTHIHCIYLSYGLSSSLHISHLLFYCS